MGALTIAFDITIVGALALPWVYLVIHLFFSDGENRIKQALDWVNNHQAQIPAGILLFAMTYTLGSAVSRIAQDFFNDDDIYIQFCGKSYDRLLRWPVTEDRIRAHVYCDDHPMGADSAMAKDIWDDGRLNLPTKDPKESDPARPGEMPDDYRQGLVPNVPKEADSAMAREMGALKGYEAVCRQFMAGWFKKPNAGDCSKPKDKENPDRLVKIMAHVFGLQENTLMDKGDYSARLRQLHDQIMVLRGAAFSGLIAFSLCLFAWGAVLTSSPGPADKTRFRNETGPPGKPGPGGKPRRRARWTFVVSANLFAILLTALAGIAWRHHLTESLRFPPDPPYLEFTLLLLAGAGAWLLWRPLLWRLLVWRLPRRRLLPLRSLLRRLSLWPTLPPSLRRPRPIKAKGAEAARKEQSDPPYLWIGRWGPLVALSFVLFLAAFLGWWSTEVIYRDQVIYSYDSQFSNAQGSAKAKK
jgi:hypothetical protein